MKIAVLGAGLMGPTIAMDCIESEEVEEVLLIDISKEKLDQVVTNLGNPPKLKTLVQDITDKDGLVKALRGYDVAGIALLRWLNVNAMWGAIEAGVDAVDLSGPAEKDIEEIHRKAEEAGVSIIPGCGVEPGLTDILAAYGMDMLDKVEAVDIWCGGIPRDPKPPLDYKIVFGGPYLPLYPGMVKVIEDGQEREVRRYTLSDPVSFEGIDRPLECFYDGFPDSLLYLDKFKGVRRCTEKTVRYMGYCEKVNFLEECGLLSRDPINFKDESVVPFEVFSKIIHPKVRLEEDERDITVLRVIVDGVKDARRTCYTFDMVDFYDEERAVTSMAKTTSYTAAIVARMLGRGEISEKGLVPPVKAIRGDLFHRLLGELADRGVTIKQAVTTQTSIH
jgi:lysine 6-dehydrogenase